MVLFDPNDPVTTLFGKAAEILTSAPLGVQKGLSAAAAFLEKLQGLSHQVDRASTLALLPLCLCLFIVHEHGRTLMEGSSFRLGHVVAKAGVVVSLVLAYPTVCHLITRIAGAGGGWMTTAEYANLSDFDHSMGDLGQAWQALGGGISNIPQFFCIVIVWMIVMTAALAAYIAGTLLSLSQAALLTLLLTVGKICITCSLLPGVTVGRGWARSLAQVAAWSTVASALTALLAYRGTAIGQLIATGQIAPLLRVSAQFVILAICTLAVPVITGKIFSGAAPHAAGVGTAIMGGLLLARASYASVRQRSQSSGRGRDLSPSTRPGSDASLGSADAPVSQRPYKAPAPRPKEMNRAAADGRATARAASLPLDSQKSMPAPNASPQIGARVERVPSGHKRLFMSRDPKGELVASRSPLGHVHRGLSDDEVTEP